MRRSVLPAIAVVLLSITAVVTSGDRPAKATVICGWKTSSWYPGGGWYLETRITPSCDPSSSGYRYVSYHYENISLLSGVGTAITEHRMNYDRAWTCGSLTYSDSRAVFNWTYISADSPWSSWNNCGLQADLSSKFYKSGAFEWWPYINF